MDYQLIRPGVVIRDDAMVVPQDDRDPMRVEYLAWIATGHTPKPLGRDPAQSELEEDAARSDAAVHLIASMTPSQARAWVASNINTLADAKTLLGNYAAILCILARRI